MNFLKRVVTIRRLLIAAAIILSAFAFWFFKGSLTSNIFDGKTFTQIPIVARIILAGVFLPVSSIILFNLLEYLFPNNLYKWFVEWIQSSHGRNEKNEHSSAAVLITPGTLFNALAAGFLAVFVLIFQEWIFLVTKESFMDALSWFDRASILIQSVWILSIIAFTVILIVWLVAYFIRQPFLPQIVQFIFRLVPSMVLAIAALLIFDNFTYIILGFGIVDSYSIYRASYGLAFILFINKTITKIHIAEKVNLRSAGSAAALLLFVLGSISAAVGIISRTADQYSQTKQVPSRTPNVILIGSDGVTADHLPMYGYERNTTPFMASIVDKALITESNYSQTGSSWGSLISIFTGKLPTQTRVVNLPDALIGNDSYQHLPGILKDLGYTNIDITYERYANASMANVRNGFDRINGKEESTSLLVTSLGKILPVNSQYNLDLLIERISDRLQHIFFIRIMPNPFKEVNTLTGRKDATSRIPELMEYVNHGDQPFFIHVHLLGTHGPSYKPTSTTFSQGRKQTKDFEVDFYDDAIVDFDNYIHGLFTALDKTARLDNTIVIIYTDHPRKRAGYLHIPLIFWFPQGEYAGSILENTENLDIAPTILDYMGLSAPDWMEGKSLLSDQIAANRPIFSVIWKSPKKNKPENLIFDQFASFRVVVCDQYVEFSTTKLAWEAGEVDDPTGYCKAEEIRPFTEMKEILIDRLKKDGFDTTLLETSHLPN